MTLLWRSAWHCIIAPQARAVTKLNISVGGAPGFLGAFGASCGSGGVRSVRQWCAVREQVRVQVRAAAASPVQCGGHRYSQAIGLLPWTAHADQHKSHQHQ